MKGIRTAGLLLLAGCSGALQSKNPTGRPSDLSGTYSFQTTVAAHDVIEGVRRYRTIPVAGTVTFDGKGNATVSSTYAACDDAKASVLEGIETVTCDGRVLMALAPGSLTGTVTVDIVERQDTRGTCQEFREYGTGTGRLPGSDPGSTRPVSNCVRWNWGHWEQQATRTASIGLKPVTNR